VPDPKIMHKVSAGKFDRGPKSFALMNLFNMHGGGPLQEQFPGVSNSVLVFSTVLISFV
jgi:hypothetical protein